MLARPSPRRSAPPAAQRAPAHPRRGDIAVTTATPPEQGRSRCASDNPSPRRRVLCPSWVLRRCHLWLPPAGGIFNPSATHAGAALTPGSSPTTRAPGSPPAAQGAPADPGEGSCCTLSPSLLASLPYHPSSRLSCPSVPLCLLFRPPSSLFSASLRLCGDRPHPPTSSFVLRTFYSRKTAPHARVRARHVARSSAPRR